MERVKEKPMNEMPVMNENEGIVLFYPNIPKTAIEESDKSSSRQMDWSGAESGSV